MAAKHAGVEPIWSSEIDPFPQAVTKHHFPDVVQLGDITKLEGDRLWPVDIVCAGSPCQDLSIANGKREGLKGERSGLFMDAIELVRRMRAATGGKYPRFFIFENVPGVFSSNKGADFRAVLSEISEAEIPMPEGGKWAPAGMVEWGSGSLVWRVLDAQYWPGTPQRRKRIFLVADFTGHSAGEILFEREGLRGDSSESGSETKPHAGGTEGNIGAAVLRMRSGKPGGGKGPLISREKSLTLATGNDQVLFTSAGFFPNNSANAHSIGYEVEKSPTLSCMDGGNKPCVVAYSICGTIIGRKDHNGGHHVGIDKEVAFTLTSADRHAVCAINHTHNHQIKTSDKVSALTVNHYDQKVIIENGYARRLTPLECERLQGLPDGYTDVEFNGRPATDTARYKALGNGMAQPCADYVIRRIVEVATDD